MDKSKSTSEAQTAKKITDVPEGLDKAEARAKRKEAKKQNKIKKDIPNNNAPNVTAVNNTVKNSAENHNDNNKPPAGGDELSKGEMKAKRRAIQEAQRQAKAVAKAVGTLQESIEKKNVDNINKIKVEIEKNNLTAGEKSSETTVSKAELRAKRRAIQEAQRLEKLQAKEAQKSKVNQENVKEITKNKQTTPKKKTVNIVTSSNLQNQVQLFIHLNFHHSTSILKDSSAVLGLHSSIIQLGIRYMSHNVLGSNARCLALLAAIKNLINDYRTPQHQEFCRSFEANLQTSTNFLQKCRPLAVSMTNAIRHIKRQLTQISTNLPDNEKKLILLDAIDTYINDEIGMADKAISITVQAKIYKGDVILTYGCSSVVMKILLDAHESGKEFSVVVVDARPLLEGREMLRKLVNAGVSCSYLMINATSFIMGRVTKVLLGAHSLLANGYVMSRAGTAQIALVAQAFNKPVLVCCETYKFCERVQTDSIVHNEIGDPDKLVYPCGTENKSPLFNWKENKCVTPLNLMYDVTPPDLVTAVVTELAILPCTSVPVILRIKPTELAL